MQKQGTVRIIKDTRPTCEGLIRCHTPWKSLFSSDESYNTGDIAIGKNWSREVFEYWEPIQIIIICDDEIKVGDKFLYRGSDIGTCEIPFVVSESERKSNRYKILVPSNKIPQSLIDLVVDKKLKDGDTVYVTMQGMWKAPVPEAADPDFYAPATYNGKAIVSTHNDNIMSAAKDYWASIPDVGVLEGEHIVNAFIAGYEKALKNL